MNKVYSRKTRLSLSSGLIARMGLTLFALVCSSILAWNVLAAHSVAYAATIRANTTTNPWGVALDGAGHIWVAEPACDASPTCLAPPVGAIGEYTGANNTLVQNFAAPAGINPVFLAIDGSGNVWFTDPSHGTIGELVPGTTPTWNQWSVTSASGMTPYDLVLVNGNIWFTDFNANSIGFFNTTMHTTVEISTPFTSSTHLPSHPYGIIVAPNGHVWFTENAINKLGEFVPTANGSGVAITEHIISNSGPHLLAADSQGNIWFSEGFMGFVGELTTGNVDHEFSLVTDICPTPGAGTPQPSCSTHISGIAVDSQNHVWFDDSLANRVGLLDPATGAFSTLSLITPNTTNPHPHDGLLVDSTGNTWVSEQFGFGLDKIQAGTIVVSSTPTVTPTTPTPPPATTVPVNKKWYFAEGRVGKGFQEYITLDNPDAALNCQVNVQYFYTLDGSTALNTKVMSMLIAHTFRATRSVNADLGILPTQKPAATVSTIVTVDNTVTPACLGVVAERPMYFNYNGVTSGDDAFGATQLGTSYTFADMQTQAGTSSFIASYFTILNPPGGSSTNITATYSVGGRVVGVQTLNGMLPGSRRTLSPDGLNYPQHVVAVVTSTQPVAIERPTYFMHVNDGNAGTISSASTVVGAQATKNHWLFAEGYTGGQFQEYLLLGNPSTTPLTATVKLEYQGGHFQTFTVPVPALDQRSVDVNQYNAHPSGVCDTSPCSVTPEVSVDVTATANMVAERELFFQYKHTVNGRTLTAMGGTDIIGQAGPATFVSYSFAEGYTNTTSGYHEWLTLQNPTANTEYISIKLINSYGRSFSETIAVAPTSRSTQDITLLVAQHLVHAGDDFRDYEVAMLIQASNGSVFVAERPMYWNTSGSSFATQGGSAALGYTGN